MIKAVLTNEILKYITEIDRNRYDISSISLPKTVSNRLRKNSKKKSSYASSRIEGNPLTEEQAGEAIESDEHRHFLQPEQEVRNYYLALNYLEEMASQKAPFSVQLILDVQALVEKGASGEKIGLRGQMPPGVLFAVYDSETGDLEYVPPEYRDVPALLEELVRYVNETDDHPLIVAAVVHYQLVTIHPFEDGNGRTARLLSGYILDTNGYGFGGIGSLEEYFAYDIEEYYDSIQMGLPADYYSGRNDPPHSEIWINYFLRMVLLYSDRVRQLSRSSGDEELKNSLSYLKAKEADMLLLLVRNHRGEFTPIEISRETGVSNRTVINRFASLARVGFVVPHLVSERIRSYELSDFARQHEKDIKKLIDHI
ncbi:MAG: Fic family protein [Firmicutes bacterium]|nr:Fic family protein [Bacillota bacterium]